MLFKTGCCPLNSVLALVKYLESLDLLYLSTMEITISQLTLHRSPSPVILSSFPCTCSLPLVTTLPAQCTKPWTRTIASMLFSARSRPSGLTTSQAAKKSGHRSAGIGLPPQYQYSALGCSRTWEYSRDGVRQSCTVWQCLIFPTSLLKQESDLSPYATDS